MRLPVGDVEICAKTVAVVSGRFSIRGICFLKCSRIRSGSFPCPIRAAVERNLRKGRWKRITIRHVVTGGTVNAFPASLRRSIGPQEARGAQQLSSFQGFDRTSSLRTRAFRFDLHFLTSPEL